MAHGGAAALLATQAEMAESLRAVAAQLPPLAPVERAPFAEVVFARDAAAAPLRAIPDRLEVRSGQSVSGVASRRLALLRSRLRQEAPTQRAA